MRRKESKKLHRLNRSDLVILLGKLEDELDRTEKENHRLRQGIDRLQSQNSSLETERDTLLKRNKKLSRVLHLLNERPYEGFSGRERQASG